MNIEIKSTSYLIPNNSSWESLHKDNKLKFAEYNNIFNNTKFNPYASCKRDIKKAYPDLNKQALSMFAADGCG